ncbi:DNA-protecting protein DprA [Wolbachia endosymbiont of Onchocerca ochengi]|uniref:DNA-protecting protein DprA n=1 Tax=Wolbachia endosymbiont of Onchocerca ochengi TaxID=100901 RepID=UPI0002DEA714|nr:DNA-protecting protein DprA [Wolbachia endosymbiont of Onchocerca ochengi]
MVVSELAKEISIAANNLIYRNYLIIAIKKRIDVVRIRENFNLYRKITELPFATKSEPQYFPQKNQIISSLLLSFIVILTLKA